MKKKLIIGLLALLIVYYLSFSFGFKLVHHYYASRTSEKEFIENEKKYWNLTDNEGNKVKKEREKLWLWFSVRGRAIDDDAYCDGNYESEKWNQIFKYWKLNKNVP